MNTKQKIVKSAGLRGKTKTEIADALDMNSSHIGKVVNELVFSGELIADGKTTTGADLFRKRRDGETVAGIVESTSSKG